MNRSLLIAVCLVFAGLAANSQTGNKYKIPTMPDRAAQRQAMEKDWAAFQQSPPKTVVRQGFLLLLDALDTHFLTTDQTEWLLDILKSRIIADNSAENFGSIYWGWGERLGDIGDGNSTQFCVQYGILIKFLFEDRLSEKAKRTLDDIFLLALNGVRNQPVRISYTNIYLMKIWNLAALGQLYHLPVVTNEARRNFDQWLSHVAKYGNREYDSPTYCGVDIESLLLLQKYILDKDLHAKASDALNFLLTDICAHYNKRSNLLRGAHSRDYNRVFSRDLLENAYMQPFFTGKDRNDRMFSEVCLTALKEHGLNQQQKKLLNRVNSYVVQRWDSLANTYACEFTGKKFSIASSNQAYSPDDKPFVIYLSSEGIPEMANITYVAEGRDDHYGIWSSQGLGEKMKSRMPANYPSNGGWSKMRHIMPLLQVAQNKNEFVMLAAGTKDHNCINDYLNSTIVLPDTFDEIWLGKNKIGKWSAGDSALLDESNTFFARFEDVGIAIRILWDNAGNDQKAALFNDGFSFNPTRESFQLTHNKALRLTLRHPDDGKLGIAMWWKVEEGLTGEMAFRKFRESVLKTPVNVQLNNDIVDVSVQTAAGKLGVKADLIKKERLNYYLPESLPADFLFNIDGREIGRPLMQKYY